jgi:hypothetical protein
MLFDAFRPAPRLARASPARQPSAMFRSIAANNSSRA